MGNETYSVEPVDDTLMGRHRVYRESDNLLPTYACGMYSLRLLYSLKRYSLQRP